MGQPTRPSSAEDIDGEAVAYDKAEQQREKRLVRKIDLLLMPILTITFGIQYYDKAVLGSAAVFGIIKDLGLSTTTNGVVSTLRYSTATAAFYWGYIIGVLPFALILQRFRVAKTLSFLVLLWGICVILTVVVTDYKGLVVQRVFLGLLEACVAPGFVLIASQWYKKREQATRLGIIYSATGLFSIFSGAVNYGLGSANGSLAPWKRMYLFAGAFTIAWAAVILYFIPDSPAQSHRWFNEEERALLARRSREQMIGRVGQSKLQWSHAKEAAFDIKLYLFFLLASAIYVCNGGVTAFGARIISSFGYDSLTTIAIQIPGGAFTCVGIYLFSWLADHYRDITTYLIPISCIPIVVGSLVIWLASWEHRGVPLFGYYLLPVFGAPYVLVLASSAANVAGSTKKAIATGVLFIGYNVGNIIAPYTVFTSERNVHYRSTWIALLVCMGVTSVLALVLRFVLARENKKRNEAEAGTESEAGESKEDLRGDVYDRQEAADMTDGQNKRFRYSL